MGGLGTHEAYFPQPTIFLKFVCLGGGGGGVLHFYHHFPEVKFLCFRGGGGAALLLFETGGGFKTCPHVERFPRFHIFPFSTCPLV